MIFQNSKISIIKTLAQNLSTIFKGNSFTTRILFYGNLELFIISTILWQADKDFFNYNLHDLVWFCIISNRHHGYL